MADETSPTWPDPTQAPSAGAAAPPLPPQPSPPLMEPSHGPLAGDLANLPIHDPAQTVDIPAPSGGNVETPTNDNDADDG